MKQATIIANHDVTIMPIFYLKKIGDKTISSQSINEVFHFLFGVEYTLKTTSLFT